MKKVNFAENAEMRALYELTSSRNRIKELLQKVDMPLGGSISLLPTGAYFVEIAVGTPPQVVPVLLDSGSFDFLVMTAGCDGCNKAVTTEFNLTSSSSIQMLPCIQSKVRCPKCVDNVRTFYNEYITCAPNNPQQPCIFEGPIVNDVFSVPNSNLQVPVNFGAVTFANITMPGVMSGIWGVAADSRYASFGEIGPLEALASSNQIVDMFSICILQDNGTFTLGGIDQDLYHGALGYTPITADDGFVVETLDIQVDGVSLGFPSKIYNQEGGSVVDTGTYSIVVDHLVYDALSERLSNSCPGSNLTGVCNAAPGHSLFDGYCFNMSTTMITTFPKIQIVLAGVTLNIDGFDYLVPNITDPGCVAWGFQDGGVGSITIHGDVAMKGMYTVFDKANKQLGFADANIEACASHMF